MMRAKAPYQNLIIMVGIVLAIYRNRFIYSNIELHRKSQHPGTYLTHPSGEIGPPEIKSGNISAAVDQAIRLRR